MSRIENKAKVLKYREQIEEILSKFPFMEVGDAKLHFIDREGDALIRSIEKSFDGREALSKRLRSEFAQVVNLLNPGKAADTYSVGIRGKHRQITDQDVVRENIEAEFSIWKNTLLKNAKKTIEVHTLSDEAIDKINQEINTTLDVANGELKYILENFDTLVVKIAGFKHQKNYPYIQFTIDDENNKRKTVNKHLSILAPNCLFYQPAIYRSDMKIDEFIKDARNPFGDIFYMKKGESENANDNSILG